MTLTSCLATLALALCYARPALAIRHGKGGHPHDDPALGPVGMALKIPKIIHYCFDRGTHTMPSKIQENIYTWKRHHPEWEFKLWDEGKNRQLVREQYPWFLHTYERLQTRMMRMDAVRYAYMHQFGGLFVDADTNASKPLDRYLAGNDIFFTDYNNHIATFFMGSVPGHPFWLAALQAVKTIHSLEHPEYPTDTTTCKTGWEMVEMLWRNKFNGTVYPPGRFGASVLRQKLGGDVDTTYSILAQGQIRRSLGVIHQRLAMWRRPKTGPPRKIWVGYMQKPMSFLQVKSSHCEEAYPGWTEALGT